MMIMGIKSKYHTGSVTHIQDRLSNEEDEREEESRHVRAVYVAFVRGDE